MSQCSYSEEQAIWNTISLKYNITSERSYSQTADSQIRAVTISSCFNAIRQNNTYIDNYDYVWYFISLVTLDYTKYNWNCVTNVFVAKIIGFILTTANIGIGSMQCNVIFQYLAICNRYLHSFLPLQKSETRMHLLAGSRHSNSESVQLISEVNHIIKPFRAII